MSTITITFGDCAENHKGMQRLGEAAADGFAHRDLVAAQGRFEAKGCRCELVDLAAEGGLGGLEPEPGPAHVLVVRGGAGLLIEEHGASLADLREEQDGLTADTRALMYGRVANKIARHNLCFDEVGQEPDYEAGKGTVVAFDDVPHLDALRLALPSYFGGKARDLKAEGNYYYDVRKCGIGFHGDSERRRVIAIRLGETLPLHFQWYLGSERVGDRIRLSLDNSDLYAMSEKAVGFDWKRKKVPTLRHAAGCAKYLA